MTARAPRLEVLSPGVQSLIEDLGRPGFAYLGVARSGAYDRSALAAANRCLGNPDSAAGIECVLGGLQLLALEAITLGVARPDQPGIELVNLLAGERFVLPRFKRGLRAYLAVPGGIDCATVLGSAATDTMSGLGPAPLAAGQLLTSGASPSTEPMPDPTGPTDRAAHGYDPAMLDPTVELAVDVLPGPQSNAVLDGLTAALGAAPWAVSPASNRVGMRLTRPDQGLAFEQDANPTPTSQPVMRGTIQAPPGGELIVLGPDAPTTGGYPVVAVVADRQLDLLAQLRPGALVSFTVRDRTAVSS